jgi:hypothetical protein
VPTVVPLQPRVLLGTRHLDIVAARVVPRQELGLQHVERDLDQIVDGDVGQVEDVAAAGEILGEEVDVLRTGATREAEDHRGVERLARLEPVARVRSVRVAAVLELSVVRARASAQGLVEKRGRNADLLSGDDLGGGERVHLLDLGEALPASGEPLGDLPEPFVVGRDAPERAT